jgi:hypothetical protein
VYVDHSKPTACVDATFFWCSKAFKRKIERPNILIFDFDVQKFRDGIRTLAQIFTHCVKKVRPSGGKVPHWAPWKMKIAGGLGVPLF